MPDSKHKKKRKCLKLHLTYMILHIHNTHWHYGEYRGLDAILNLFPKCLYFFCDWGQSKQANVSKTSITASIKMRSEKPYFGNAEGEHMWLDHI